MFVLYHGWKSSASRRVRLCLAEKGLKYESRIIDLAKGEPAMRALHRAFCE